MQFQSELSFIRSASISLKKVIVNRIETIHKVQVGDMYSLLSWRLHVL